MAAAVDPGDFQSDLRAVPFQIQLPNIGFNEREKTEGEREGGKRGQRQSQSSAAAAPSLFQQSKQLSRPCWGETSASRLPAVLRHPLKTEASLVHGAAQLRWNAFSHAHTHTNMHIQREQRWHSAVNLLFLSLCRRELKVDLGGRGRRAQSVLSYRAA